MKKANQVLALIFNVAIAVLGFIGAYLHWVDLGWAMLKFYTVDSNIFCMIACAICAAYGVIALAGKLDEIPVWARFVKYLSVCTVMVTFLVVVFVLAPMATQGMDVMGLDTVTLDKAFKALLTHDAMLYHHLLCPILSLISLLLFDAKPDFRKSAPKGMRKPALTATIFTLVYGGVTIVLNVLRLLEGPYPFLMVYDQPVYMSIIWACIIFGIALLIAWLILKLWKPKRATEAN